MSGILGICLVTQSDALRENVRFVIEQLNSAIDRAGRASRAGRSASVEAISQALGRRPHSESVLETLMVQAQGYLFDHLPDAAQAPRLSLLHFASEEAAREGLRSGTGDVPVDLFIVDHAHLPPEQVCDPFDALFEAGVRAGRPQRLTPHSAMLFCSPEALPRLMLGIGGNRHLRVRSGDHAACRADLLRLLLDHLEHAHFNRMLARSVNGVLPPVSMASEITRFMRSRWGDAWDFHSYTGSMVAGFIQSMQQCTADSGVRCLHGCNEHSLAVASLAGWQLFERAFVIAVTSGMLDEFRGTLSNLKRAEAPGLIVCADSPDSTWFAFQGTMDVDNDGRQVIAARGLRHVFIRKVEEIGARLEEAFAMLAERSGPVFILATQGVLESRPAAALQVSLPAPPQPAPALSLSEVQRAALDEAMRLINQQPLHILWRCGQLNADQRVRVQRIARRAGIALADSITQPGSIGPYQHGDTLPNYLGPLSLYGFSRRVYKFLHTDHEMNGVDSQCVFFLKSKVDQAATPFSEGKLKRQLKVVQVNHNPRHISPFSDLVLDLPLDTFLACVESRLNVDDEVLREREAKLSAMRRIPEAVPTDYIHTTPMTTNYFFRRLGALVRDLIEQEDYRYIGVYDVGRCGVSAVRNVPRTGPGFSGWYGRALMGDALIALPYIAITGSQNVLAFVGDGARALVPDIEARLVAGLAQDPLGARKNVTLFYLTNGVLSLIQTYLDKRYAHNGAVQVAVPSLRSAPPPEPVGSVSLRRERLSGFDEEALRAALTEPGRLNIFDVLLAHNSEGDGLSLVSETTWNRR
ncbi:decarboxylase [Ralstonia solanacearum]|uniref:decarboxylase n=1 Tax=Ralstonia solanacearum TaxID=305 RepID=UPI00078C10BB|nr:decarboxylase [Ralstonia solanacearum]AMP39864.1 decarboxylase [Ralstonia solanacearum]AXV88707.1 decarboxylase [Ralstonia solanacearum]AXW08179.1 decarboxylase [Ralstonia solanacearum]AXW25970.1 decarboxylase [Ralstonia solanacearum]AXW82880.1 decarboxylase [Ralstonia solanacearum]